ncbi:cupin domain-containing protein [Streptomyces sp. NPDC004647]|uniref:JmjC domain-containing protein n=1 Tax=Streptomyces sp. NPDC004647 TaxID=3154671 RepID=UPI0033BFA1A1
MSLETLIDNPDTVLARWPSEPLRFHREPAAFHHLLTLPEVEELVDAECLPMRNVVLLKDGEVAEKYTYADGDMPRRGAVRAHLNGGGSISLRELERMKPSIAGLYRALHAQSGYQVHVNAYLTPAGAQGLKYHYDPYVTLILQLSGRKTWPVHRPFVQNPVQEFESFHLVGFTPEQRHYLANTPPVAEFTLAPGDVLWLPRGWPHSPYTVGDEPSLHLTVAFKERTFHWLAAQLVDDVLAQALVDPQMREALAPREVTEDTEPAVRLMREYLIGALLHMDVPAAAKYAQAAALR